MRDNELVKELHELERHNQTPIALIEMFDALLSSRPETARQAVVREIRRDHGEPVAVSSHRQSIGYSPARTYLSPRP